jgi:cytochrome c biogenesis protein CcmG/thiol:disulfide interchange protein DsbE
MATHNDDLDLERWTESRLAQLDRQRAWEPDATRALTQFRQKARRGAHRSRTFAIAGALVAAMSAGVLAFPPAHAFAERCIAACVDQSARLGAYLRGRPPAARLTAPDFSLTDRSGHAVSLSAYRGQVVLINFWATWCSPCKREIPWLVEFQTKYKDRGFTVLGLSVDEDGWTSVTPYLDASAINYPVAIANDDVTTGYGGITAVPMTFVIDRTGRVAATHLGLLNRDGVEAEIQSALAR